MKVESNQNQTKRTGVEWGYAVARARMLTSAIVGLLEHIAKMRIETEMNFFERRLAEVYYEEEMVSLRKKSLGER